MAKVEKNKVYLGKVLKKLVKTKEGAEVEISKLLIDNPAKTNSDGTANSFFQGNLIWRSADGSEYVIKQGIFGGVSDKSASAGFTRSLVVDLNNAYEVEKIK